MDKAKVNGNEDKSSVKDIELVDIEDNVPNGGNSLFLCLARVIIYMSHKNPRFVNALCTFTGIDKNHLRSDLSLQSALRIRLCEYFIQNGIFFDHDKKKFILTNEYFNYFNGNVYDFIIQVYQLSINNFCNNSLYRKFALSSISKLLKIKLYYKKSNGQWKFYDSESNFSTTNNKLDSTSNLNNLMECLNETTIYLQEIRFDPDARSSQTNTFKLSFNKSVRLLLDKKLWLSNYLDNNKICLKFSQFNDLEQLKIYREPYFLIDSIQFVNQILSRMKTTDKRELNIYQRTFFVLINKLSVEVILDSTNPCGSKMITNNNENLQLTKEVTSLIKTILNSAELNTIGKQYYSFELARGKDALFVYMNLWLGKNIFNDDFVNRCYSNILEI